MLGQSQQITPGTHRDVVNKESVGKKVNENSPKINVKGITLKQYFRMCEECKANQTIFENQDQSRQSSHSQAETPKFNEERKITKSRVKYKTELSQLQPQNIYKNNNIKHPIDLDITNRNHIKNTEKLKNIYIRDITFKKRQDRKKIYSKIHSQSNKYHPYELVNRSTLNSFYQIELNKQKMLKKVQVEKERVNEMRLSQAFFITKYGSKFNLNTKLLIK